MDVLRLLAERHAARQVAVGVVVEAAEGVGRAEDGQIAGNAAGVSHLFGQLHGAFGMWIALSALPLEPEGGGVEGQRTRQQLGIVELLGQRNTLRQHGRRFGIVAGDHERASDDVVRQRQQFLKVELFGQRHALAEVAESLSRLAAHVVGRTGTAQNPRLKRLVLQGFGVGHRLLKHDEDVFIGEERADPTQLECHFDKLAAALIVLRQLLQGGERLFEKAHGFTVRAAAHGLVACLRRVLRLFAVIACRAPMIGQHRRLFGRVRIGRFNRLGDPPVQKPALVTRQADEYAVAQLVVGEAPAIVLHFEHGGVGAFGQPVVERSVSVFGRAADNLTQHVQIQLPSGNRRRLQERARAGGQPAQAALDNALHAAGKYLGRQGGRSDAAKLAGLLGKRAHDFDQEEHIALGFALKQVEHIRLLAGAAEHGCAQLGDAGLGEPFQLEDVGAGQFVRQVGAFVVAVAAEYEQGRCARQRNQARQQVQTFVRPL